METTLPGHPLSTDGRYGARRRSRSPPPPSRPVPSDYVAYASSSESCPAGQPVLAVKVSRRYRRLVAGNVTVTVLPVAGLKVYPAGPATVPKVLPSLEPSIRMVWVRVPQAPDGGSLSTNRLTLVGAPRSTWNHSGNALSALSQ